jgi:hypothetical protein
MGAPLSYKAMPSPSGAKNRSLDCTNMVAKESTPPGGALKVAS